MSEEKRYRLEVKQVGTDRTVEAAPGMRFTATELGKVLVVKVPDQIIGYSSQVDSILDSLAEATQEAASYIVLAKASQPLEFYAVEVPAELKEPNLWFQPRATEGNGCTTISEEAIDRAIAASRREG